MKLEDWRNEINGIDAEIVNLIRERAQIVRKIGVIKGQSGLPVADVSREEEILRFICRSEKDLRENEAIVNIFKQIIHESKQIQIDAISKILQNGAETGR